MVARGFGIETLCLYLAIAQTALLDLVVALGLATPHNRPHRRAGGRNPWLTQEIPVLIALWMEGWQAASLAERFGRSPSGVWSKARQLGLPRRDRKTLFRPADARAPFAPDTVDPALAPSPSDVCPPDLSPRARQPPKRPAPCEARPSRAAPTTRTSVAATAASVPGPAAPLLAIPTTAVVVNDASAVPVHALGLQSVLPLVGGTGLAGGGVITAASSFKRGRRSASIAAKSPPSECLDLPLSPAALASPFRIIKRIGARQQIPWQGQTALDDLVGMRGWGRQHYRIAAAELGISVATYLTRRYWLQVPKASSRDEFYDEFDPDIALREIARCGYKRVQCRAFKQRGIEFFFWSRKIDHVFTSNFAKSKPWYRDMENAAAW